MRGETNKTSHTQGAQGMGSGIHLALAGNELVGGKQAMLVCRPAAVAGHVGLQRGPGYPGQGRAVRMTQEAVRPDRTGGWYQDTGQALHDGRRREAEAKGL